MKIRSKAKEKVNKKLKNKYPLFFKEIDEHYNDVDFHTVDYDEITGKSTYSTAEQYEHELDEVLSNLMIPIEEEKERLEEERILGALSHEPCGIWGD